VRLWMRNLLGGKGANLAEMSNLGLPVPPGFTITTEVCTYYYANGRLSGRPRRPGRRGAGRGRRDHGRQVRRPAPLLVSVRSGARASMPGMMDTVLNLGLNDETVGRSRRSGDERFAYDSYRRFIQMYSDVVLGVDQHLFEEMLETTRTTSGYTSTPRLTADDWKELVERYKAWSRSDRQAFPQDPHEQLWGAIGAVFGSWMNSAPSPTAACTTFPTTGAPRSTSRRWCSATWARPRHRRRLHPQPLDRREGFYGEFLVNAQGEDVVAGIRTPAVPHRGAAKAAGSGCPSMEEVMPEPYAELGACATGSRSTTATCRTSSSPSSAASSGCCRPAPASAPPRRR
jgi:pyruvate, orthophosphate dikinase